MPINNYFSAILSYVVSMYSFLINLFTYLFTYLFFKEKDKQLSLEADLEIPEKRN